MIIPGTKAENWLKVNFYLVILALLVYLFMPFFWDGWINAHCEEDAYYYFSIARNLVQGKGLTYAGEWTNGFQPLWLFLLSGFFWLNNSLLFPIKMALMLGGIFFLGSGLLIYRSGLLLFQDKTRAYLASILWLSSVFAWEHSVNGLETGFYYLCLAGLIYVYLKCIRLKQRPAIRDWIYLGGVSGLCFLARIDASLLLIPIWISGLWHSYKVLTSDEFSSQERHTVSEKLFQIFKEAFAGLLIFLGLALPWAFYNLWLWGNPFPVSAFFAKLQFWQPMTFRNRALFSLKAFLRLPIFYPFSFYTFFRHWNKMNFILLLLGSGIWLGAILFDRKLRTEFWGLPVWSLVLAGVFLTLGYLISATAHWFFPRYLSPLILFLIFHSALLWGHYLGKKPALLGIFCAFLISSLFLLDFYSTLYKNAFPQYYLNVYRLNNLDWIEKKLAPQYPIGCFQSGLYGYYLSTRGFQVYNLDGKMSLSAYQALKTKSLDRYFQERKIFYLIDWPNYLYPIFKEYQMVSGQNYKIISRLGSDLVVEILYNKKSDGKD